MKGVGSPMTQNESVQGQKWTGYNVFGELSLLWLCHLVRAAE